MPKRFLIAPLAAVAICPLASTAPAAAITVVRPPTTPATKLRPVPKVSTRTTVRSLPILAVGAPKAPLAFPGPIPQSVNLTKYAMAVGDQGSLGSCVSWSVAYGLVGWWANRKGILKKLPSASPRAAATYDWFHPMLSFHTIGVPVGTKSTDPYKGQPTRDGAYIPDGFFDLANSGSPPSTSYTGALGTWDYFHAPNLVEQAAASRYRIKSGAWQTLFAHGGADMSEAETKALKGELSLNHPVVLAIRVESPFKNWSGGGIFAWPNAGTISNHAVLALGYDSQSVLIQNSWGTDWGDKGWIRVSWDWLKDSADEAYAITDNSPFLTP